MKSVKCPAPAALRIALVAKRESKTCSPLIWGAFALCCASLGGLSAGAEPRTEVKPYQFKTDGSEGVEYVRTLTFSSAGRNDGDFVVEFEFKGDLLKLWEVAYVDGYIGDAHSTLKMNPQPIPLRSHEARPSAKRIWVMNVRDGAPYTFVLKLKPKNKDVNRDATLHFLETDKTAIQVTEQQFRK